MPFERGSVTFTTFKLNGAWPEDALDNFNAYRAGTLDSVKDDVQIGWTTGRCLLDSNLDTGQITAKQMCHLTDKLPGACLHFRNKQAWDFPGGSVLENPPFKAGDKDSIPGRVTKSPHA